MMEFFINLTSLLWYGSICSQVRYHCWANDNAPFIYTVMYNCVIIVNDCVFVLWQIRHFFRMDLLLRSLRKCSQKWIFVFVRYLLMLLYEGSHLMVFLYCILQLFPSVKISTLTSGLANLRNLFIQYLARYSYFSPKRSILWFLF
jgi:hypothetical protein